MGKHYPALRLGLALVALSCCSTRATAEEASARVAGSITSFEGEVVVQRGEEFLAAAEGLRLHRGDMVRTGADGAAGIVFRDDTTLSLGADTEISVDEFQFEPAQGLLAMTLEIVKGSLACLTGRIAEIAPESMQIETPVGIMGVRGTKFIVEVRP